MNISIDKEVVASYSANKLQMGIFDEFVGHEDLWGKELDKPMFYVYNIRVNSQDIKVLGDKQNTLKIELDNYTIMFFKMTEQRINEFGINFGEIVDDKTKKREVLYSNQDLSIDVIGTLDINVYENKYTHRITRTNQIIVDDFEIKVIENSFEDLM
jgi:hypothetical protein